MAPSAWAQLATDVRVFFITIAVLLGTGILGLPVTLVNSGFEPFLVVFTVTFVMQLATVLLQADNMQLAQKLLVAQRPDDGSHVNDPLPQPDLHSMGRLFLPRGLALAFDASVLVTFISTLISYALAGASAFSDVLGVPTKAVILPFVVCCVLIIVFLGGVVQPLISALTSVKVLLLCFIIGAVGLVSEQVAVEPGNSWTTVMQPFLIGTVAIGGIADTMPVMISGAELTRRAAVVHFRWAVSAGVLACFVLNVLWGLFVLHIVPQTEADAEKRGWSEDLSLEYAAKHGQIATIPVTAVIDKYFSQYSWVARLVTIFIVLSICVSFNAIGLALKHALDGIAVSVLQLAAPYLGISPSESAALSELLPSDPHAAPPVSGEPSTASFRARAAAWFSGLFRVRAACASAAGAMRALWAKRSLKFMLLGRGSLYVFSFGIVLIVALGVFTSMSLNLAGGVFVAMMFWGARRPAMRQLLASAAARAAQGTRELAPRALPDFDAPSSPLLLSGGGHGGPRKASGGGGDTGPTTPRVGLSSTAGAGDIAGIALPLSEAVGHALALLASVSFVLAVVYDVEASSVVPVGQAWATAFTGLAFVLAAHHVLRPSVEAVAGASDADDQGARSGSVQDLYLEEAEGAALVPGAAGGATPAVSCCRALASFGPQCEAVACGTWLVYGAAPGTGPMVVAVVVCLWQLVLLHLVLRWSKGSPAALRVPLAGTLLDALSIGAWGIALLLRPDRAAVGGGLAVGIAGVLFVALVLRWQSMPRHL